MSFQYAVELPEFMPDQSANSGVLLKAENCYPAIDGYRPVKAPQTLSEALDDEFRGGFSFISSTGTAYLLAGTSTGLYKLDTGAWTTSLSGLTISDRWSAVQFGNYAVLVNKGATVEFDLTAGTASNIAGAPTGEDVAVVGDYVVVTQPGGDRLKVRWGAFNSHTAWTLGVDQAGEQIMNTGGEVMGIAGGEFGVILQRFRLVRMNRTGDATAPFSFDEITPNVGCASKGSIVQEGRNVYFLSDRGFMALADGQAPRPIGTEKVDRAFAVENVKDEYSNIWSVIDPANKLVMWGLNGKIWVYNYELDRWSTIKTAFNGLFGGYTSSLTLEGVAATYTNIDTMPYSLDDPRFSGGDPRLYIATGGDELAVFNSTNMASCFELSFTELTPSKRTRLQDIRPVMDATGGLTLTVDARARLGDAPDTKTVSSIRDSGTMPIRHSGRHMQASLAIEAGQTWSYFQGLIFDFNAGGGR